MNYKKAKDMTASKFLKTFISDSFTIDEIVSHTKRQPTHVRYWINRFAKENKLIISRKICTVTNVENDCFRLSESVTVAAPVMFTNEAPAPVSPVTVAAPVAAPVATAHIAPKQITLKADDNNIYVTASIPKIGLSVTNMEISQFCALLDAVNKTKK